jgi:hypothetical protein
MAPLEVPEVVPGNFQIVFQSFPSLMTYASHDAFKKLQAQATHDC